MRGRFRIFSRAGIGLSAFAMSALLAGCGGGGGSTPTQTTQAVSVTVSPAAMSLNGGGSHTFSATVANDSANAGVTWSIGTGAGTLSASSTNGVTYTAPSTITTTSTVTLTATSKTDATKSAAATITLSPPAITVTVSPATASLTGGGSQTFAATVANDPANAGVTWSIGSGTGTLSASSTTGVTYTAPSTITATSTVTLTATSKTETSVSGTATITLNPSSVSTGIAITGFSTTTPTPLTLLQIDTTGINASSAVTVTFSDSAGFSATEQAIRVQSGGTVIAGVPLYVDPTTGQFGQGTVSVVLTQGAVSSASSSLTIQTLPTVSSYGVQPGQISHAFLVFSALVHARRLNEFQAAQQLVGTSVNTSTGQSAMQDMITASNDARSDVDSIAANSATTFSWGSLSGKTIQFDSTQLDAMDRIIAVYLSQQFVSPGISGNLRLGPLSAHKQSASPAVSFSSMGSLLTCLASNENACFMQAQEAVQSSSNPTDTSTAWLTGLKTTLSVGGAEQEAALPGLAQGLVQVSTAMDSLTHAISDTATCIGSLDGCDASAQQAVESELNSAGAGIVSSISQTISQVPALLGLELEAQQAGIANDGLQGLTKIMADESSGALGTADATDLALVSSTNQPLLNGNLGYATGIADEASGQTSSTPQNSLDLCCFGTSGLGIVALADQGGYYDLLVPIGVADTSYGTLTLSEDSSSGTLLDSETVALSDITSTATVSAQTLDPSSPPPAPTAPPSAGSYAGTCTVQVSSITCSSGGVSTTAPGISSSSAFDYTVPSGTTLSQFDSAVCGQVDPAMSEAGCATESCNYAASTSTSFTFSLSCTLPPVSGCTTATVSETCSASN
jgi:hypothetical protein